MKKLDIKNRNALDRAASFQHAFLNKDLFEECCVQLGVEYIRDLFTQNTTGVDMLST